MKVVLHPVLRIQLVLMRIRILDPHFKKMHPDLDPGYFFKIYWFFLTKQNFKICCLIFFAYFFAYTLWTIQKSGNFLNLSFFNSSDLGFGSTNFFFAVFGWYFAPWIRIPGSAYFCGSGSRKLKSCKHWFNPSFVVFFNYQCFECTLNAV